MPAQSRTTTLTSPAENFPRWYQEILDKAELVSNGPVRGTMVIRPYGYALWEAMQTQVDRRIKAVGAQNVYLPLFIPESYLKREAEHVEGFSPELAVVTHAGGKQLAEPVVVRPTSETLFGEVMSEWISSHRDLPLLLNQWANVVRWEMRPRLFLRSTEFLWQEGHTAHASREDASAYARRVLLEVYRDFLTDVLAIPVEIGVKTARERFAGAINTMTCEGLMGDGKALQMATSHELGQRFATAFNIAFSDASGLQQTAWTTSWGCSTRMVGGLIMAHGDEAGLRLPPAVAPIQVVVMVVRDGPGVAEAATRVASELRAKGIRATIDASTEKGFGQRSVDWELKGVPVRVELGPRDLESQQAVLVRRIDRSKATTPLASLNHDVQSALDATQSGLLAAGRARSEAMISSTSDLNEAVGLAEGGLVRIPISALGSDGEDRLAAHAVSIRCLQRRDGSLPASEDEPDLVALAGRSY